MVDIAEMLKQAVFDGVVNCSDCGMSMEPDADVCPECKKPNVLRKMGYI